MVVVELLFVGCRLCFGLLVGCHCFLAAKHIKSCSILYPVLRKSLSDTNTSHVTLHVHVSSRSLTREHIVVLLSSLSSHRTGLSPTTALANTQDNDSLVASHHNNKHSSIASYHDEQLPSHHDGTTSHHPSLCHL